MKGHLSDALLMDALDGVLDAGSRHHLHGCAACAARLEEARAGLATAVAADVPEPDPLYWEAFRRQVGRRIEEEAQPRRWLAAWWPALAATAAGVVAAVAFLGPGGPATAPRGPSPAAVVPAWTVPVEVASAMSPDTEADPPLLASDCGDVSECLAEMSDEDAEALAELLGEELRARP
jgi:hypothetical protein